MASPPPWVHLDPAAVREALESGSSLAELRAAGALAAARPRVPKEKPQRIEPGSWSFAKSLEMLVEMEFAIALHPNKKHSSSADPLYGVRHEWGIAGSSSPFAWPPGSRGGASEGPRLPTQHSNHPNLARYDKLGLPEVRAIVKSRLRPMGDHDFDSISPMILNDGDDFQWWRWVSNLGRLVPTVIGVGIVNFGYDYQNDRFIVEREDGSVGALTYQTQRPEWTPLW